MFCLVRRNAAGTARHAAEIIRLVQATWGTLNLQAIHGFQGFWGLVSDDDGERVASASFYADKGAASAASNVIEVWVRTHARQLLPHPPEVFLGECFVHEAPEPPRDASVYCYPLHPRVAGRWRRPDRSSGCGDPWRASSGRTASAGAPRSWTKHPAT